MGGAGNHVLQPHMAVLPGDRLGSHDRQLPSYDARGRRRAFSSINCANLRNASRHPRSLGVSLRIQAHTLRPPRLSHLTATPTPLVPGALPRPTD
eukprot:scaffold310287_cov33-Tisochrysis_lutea.AAC.2